MAIPKKISGMLQQAIVAISRQGAEQSRIDDIRRLLLSGAKLARTPFALRQAVSEIARMEEIQEREAGSWISHELIGEGQSGRFDACDLRCWLAIARRAEVPAIEARPILSLEPAELGQLLGAVEFAEDSHAHRAIARISSAIGAGQLPDHGSESDRSDASDVEALLERCFAAMDDIPEGWMVRSHTCGGNDLKALAGCGVTENKAPEVRFGQSLEVGPGWIRQGNRRRVTFEDERILKLYMHDDSRPLTFLARPWVPSSRYLEARDPHRSGTPLDVPGEWPAEWRAFVQHGKVTGVSFYYPHAGRADAVSARMALEVRALAQRMVEQATADQQQPRMMEAAFLQDNPHHRDALEILGLGEDSFSCTLDFIETADGLMLLEGGPPCTPFGGGHPCAFFSERSRTRIGERDYTIIDLEGVAFRHQDVLAPQSPSGTGEGPQADVRSWADVEYLANGE